MKSKTRMLILLMILLPLINCKAQSARSSGERENNISKMGSINAVSAMNTSRAAHTATLLGSGKVLIAGGFKSDENALASAEIFDPLTNTFSNAGNMSVGRAGHSATLLPGGKVLIAGGLNNGEYLDSAEIYDAKTGKFAPAGKMTLPRSGHITVLLGNGKVLLAGGVGTNWTFLADAEIYDPSTNSFSKTGNMTTARESHTATLLRDGRVLITGGHQGRRSAIEIYRSAEIYNPQNGSFTAAADLTIKRHKHDAVLLRDGRVLIVGGSDERDSKGVYASVEIYDAKTGKFDPVGDMKLARYKLQGTSVLLKNGKVLLASGADQAEIFNPADNSFEIVEGNFAGARLFATATLLQSGRVLIAGGYDSGNSVSSKAWIYKA